MLSMLDALGIRHVTYMSDDSDDKPEGYIQSHVPKSGGTKKLDTHSSMQAIYRYLCS